MFVLGTLVHQASVVAVIRPPFRVWLYEVLLDLRAELLPDPSESAEQRIVASDGVANLEEVDDGDDKKDPDDGCHPTEVSVDPDRQCQGDREQQDDDSDGCELGSSYELSPATNAAIKTMKPSTPSVFPADASKSRMTE